MNLKPFCSLYSLCSWSTRPGLVLSSPPNVEPKLTICPHLHGVQLCPTYLQTVRPFGHLLLFWSPWWLVVAPEMSNDLYKHHATDPRKETTNTKIGEIKIVVFFRATHLFGKNPVEAFNASSSWHLLPLHPSFILHPFTPFLVSAFRNGSRWSQAVEDDAWSTHVPQGGHHRPSYPITCLPPQCAFDDARLLWIWTKERCSDLMQCAPCAGSHLARLARFVSNFGI